MLNFADAFLNWYFIHVVNARLVRHHGLKKYKSLVTYYTRLGVVSVCMDVRVSTVSYILVRPTDTLPVGHVDRLDVS